MENYNFSTYDSHSELCDAIRLIKGVHKPGWGYFLRAESFYNVATAEDEYSREPGGVPIIMSNHMARVFLRWHRTISKQMEYTF